MKLSIASSWAAVSAAAPTAAAGTFVVVLVPASSTSADGHWQALNNATLAWLLAGIHAVVDRKVPADHVCRFCRFVSSKLFGGVGGIARVFTVVDSHAAGPATS